MKTACSLLLSFVCAVGAFADYPEEWKGALQCCSWFSYLEERGVFSPRIKMYVWCEDIDGDGDTDIWVSDEWAQNGRLGLTWHPFFWTGEEYELRPDDWKDVPLQVAQGTGNVVEIDYERGYGEELLDVAKPQTNFADRVEALWEAKDFHSLWRMTYNRRRLDPGDLAALLIQAELDARASPDWVPLASTDKALELGAKMEGKHFKAVYPALVERMEEVKSLCRECSQQRRSGQTPPARPTPPSFPGLPFLRALEEDGFFLRGLPLQDVKGSKP
jgi:hypothetical protein